MHGGEDPRLVVRRWGDQEAVLVPAGTMAFSPEISPDGTEVAFLQQSELEVSPLQGGVIRTLTDSASCCARWGTDGFIYFSPVGPRSIRRVPEQGGPVEAVTERQGDGDGAHGDFQVLSGGRSGVFTVWGPDFDRIEALDMETGERSVVTPGINPYYLVLVKNFDEELRRVAPR